jgi:hypothetical protein
MALSALNIRNLDDRVKERLRIRGARHGRSMEPKSGPFSPTPSPNPARPGACSRRS